MKNQKLKQLIFKTQKLKQFDWIFKSKKKKLSTSIHPPITGVVNLLADPKNPHFIHTCYYSLYSRYIYREFIFISYKCNINIICCYMCVYVCVQICEVYFDWKTNKIVFFFFAFRFYKMWNKICSTVLSIIMRASK